jgi:hypothetical protein
MWSTLGAGVRSNAGPPFALRVLELTGRVEQRCIQAQQYPPINQLFAVGVTGLKTGPLILTAALPSSCSDAFPLRSLLILTDADRLRAALYRHARA